jgi:hypothetical protein
MPIMPSIAPAMVVPAASRQAGGRTVLKLWLVLSMALLALSWPSIAALKASDPDDYMRLAEVRDWLAGQSWFDVSQHRMGLPPGAEMHWSRLVDLPIAALLWSARLFLSEPLASAAAMALVPLLELLVAMLLLRRLLRELGACPATSLTAAAIPLLFPVLTSNFMPMRIDHHAWQAICALACALAIQRHDWRGSATAGALAAIWLSISLEGMVLVFALSGLLAWRTLRHGQPALAWFSGAAAATGTAIAAATRYPETLAIAHADQLSWPHIAAFLSAALVLLLFHRFSSFASARIRVIALSIAALAGATCLIAGLGAAAMDPFHGMDPVVRALWLENVPEGLSFVHQDWRTRAALIWTALLVVVGWHAALRRGDNAQGWRELAMFALAACALSFLLTRAAVAAQLLTVPFAAVLLTAWFPCAARLPSPAFRVPAMLGCILVLTPSLASLTGRLADRLVTAPAASHPTAGAVPASACNLAELARLQTTRILAPIDLGPEILARTAQGVAAGPYHRNAAAIRSVIEVFSGSLADAHTRARATGSAIMAFCPTSAEMALYRTRRPDNLANALASGQQISWLSPLPQFGNGLKVYRIRD